MAKKWIINNGNLVLGNVEYHRDLAKNHKLTRGGGLWHYEKDKNILYLYGESVDFGTTTLQGVISAMKDCMIRYGGRGTNGITYADQVTIMFSTMRGLLEAINDVRLLPIQVIE